MPLPESLASPRGRNPASSVVKAGIEWRPPMLPSFRVLVNGRASTCQRVVGSPSAIREQHVKQA